MLAGYTIENWTLPKDYTREVAGINLRSFSDTPKSWLPVYLNTNDMEERKRRDDFCNRCLFLSDTETGEISSADGRAYEGGVVFMDEYSRCSDNVDSIIMGLTNEHRFGDNYRVASKWGFLFASNRALDEGKPDSYSDDERYNPSAAKSNRFQHVTYVPTKKDWLVWARSVNPNTGEANVEPFITDFIEASPEHVWYSTVVNGGYDDMLENPEVDKLQHQSGAESRSNVEQVLSQNTIKNTKRMVTPRSWGDYISPAYRKELKRLLRNNIEGLTGEEYYNKLVKQSIKVKTDKSGKSYKEYVGGILPELLIKALNNIDDDYWDDWYEQQGGDNKLNPGGEYVGIRARYNIFQNWFINMVRQTVADGSGTNGLTASSPLMNSWRDYQTYAKNFTPDVIQSIWETGEMPDAYKQDDNIGPLNIAGFQNTEYSKWKQYTSIIQDVLNTIWTEYPGNIIKDVAADVKKMSQPNMLTDKQVKDEVVKLENEYAITINNKTIKLLFNNEDKANIDFLRNKVHVLENSKVARRLTNFAKWVSKLALQTQMNGLCKIYASKI
jgi:hypothetical protein